MINQFQMEEPNSLIVCVSGIKGVGKRTFISAITNNKRTVNNIPVMSITDPKTHKEYTLCFFVNNIPSFLANAGNSSNQKNQKRENSQQNRMSYIEEKPILEFNSSSIPSQKGLHIFMYDITYEKSFSIIKSHISKQAIKEVGCSYLIGNKFDRQLDHRQVDFEDAQEFARNNEIMFSEVSSTTKKNIDNVFKIIKNMILNIIKGENKKPPALPPRDNNLDDIEESIYSVSLASELERKLVEKMYYNNTASAQDNESNPYSDNKSIQSVESKQLGTGQFGDFKGQRSEANFHYRPQTQIVSSRSSDNLMRNSNRKNRNHFYHNMRYTEDDFKADNEEDGYDSFLRKYQIDGGKQESTTQHETFNANKISNYSNFIEQKKLENNLSFSNNDVEPNDESGSFESDNNLHNLDEIDLNYDDFARREQEPEVYKDNLSQDLSIVEDRVRQIPYDIPKQTPKQKENAKETQIINENQTLDHRISLVEEEIKTISDQYLEKKNNIPRTRRSSYARNDDFEASNDSLAVSKTFRGSKLESPKDLTFFENDLNSKSLVDIRTKSKIQQNRNSEKKDRSTDKKRPQSSRTKRTVINHNSLHKPAAEGEIMMRVSVAISEDTVYVVNVYKNDTAYAVADRCISQHLNKMRDSLTIKPKVSIALKKTLAKLIQDQVNSAITHLRDEVEKDEARVFKENLKKLEQKK